MPQSTNEYRTVCNYCSLKTWYDSEQPCKREIAICCKECNRATGKYKPCPGTLKVIDRSNLDARLDRYYQSGERIEVIYKDGSKDRFYVGKSTGWRPVYLEIKKANSSGGGSIYLTQGAQVRGLGTYKHS